LIFHSAKSLMASSCSRHSSVSVEFSSLICFTSASPITRALSAANFQLIGLALYFITCIKLLYFQILDGLSYARKLF
jgi:hypothetical protein